MAEREQSVVPARTEGVLALSTRFLDVREGRDEWRNTLGSLYAEMDVSWPSHQSELDAEWGGRPLGDLHVSSIRCGAHTVMRTPAMIRSDACADYLVCVVTDGYVEVHQSGRTASLERGAFALLALDSPFTFRSSSSFRQVVVRVPRRMVATRLPDEVAARATGRAFDHSAGSLPTVT